MSIDVNIADIREGYEREGLTVHEVDSNPIVQFEQWMQEAVDAGISQPNALTLATASKAGRPSARIVLLKAVTQTGFVFYTNYNGRKGQELAENPYAAMVFLWPSLSRQVRVEGVVTKVSDATSDAYYQSRPRGSKLGAWASPQSEVVENRKDLEEALAQYSAEYADKPVPRPAHWGGYCLQPDAIEFWQGRPSRLHDRILFRATSDGQWVIERLAP
ncbi:MAG: pyridoxamine 5'-phosphate oxidase [Bacteroidota bacterium]